MTPDGRFVAFESAASNLVPGDTNAPANSPYGQDVFVKDLRTGRTVRASVGPTGQQGRGGSEFAFISADGRYVAFITSARALVARAAILGLDPQTKLPPFALDGALAVKDRVAGRLVIASYVPAGQKVRATAAAQSYEPSLSANGRYVAFVAGSSNALGAAVGPVYVRDLRTGALARADVGDDGIEGRGGARTASISGDGRYVAFCSGAPSLMRDQLGGVFVKDMRTGVLKRVARPCPSTVPPRITTNGHYLVYISGVTVGVRRVDLTTGKVETIAPSGTSPQISANGRFVAYASGSPAADVYVRDMSTGATWRLGIAGPHPTRATGLLSPIWG